MATRSELDRQSARSTPFEVRLRKKKLWLELNLQIMIFAVIVLAVVSQLRKPINVCVGIAVASQVFWLSLAYRYQDKVAITMSTEGFSYFGAPEVAWKHFRSVEVVDSYTSDARIALTQRNGTVLEIPNLPFTSSMDAIYLQLKKRI